MPPWSRQDLDEHDGIRHGIGILGRGFHLVAHNRDVWVCREAGVRDANAQI